MIAPTEAQEPFAGGRPPLASSSPNEPTPAEVEFVSRYVDRELGKVERQLDAGHRTPAAIPSGLNRILAAFADLGSDDGGNYPLRQRVDQATGFDVRLARLGFPPLRPREAAAPTPRHRPRFSHRIMDLEEFLLELEGGWRAAEPLPIRRPEFQQLAGYLGALAADVAQGEKPAGLIFLLRDTLLLYLGARLLRAHGAPINPRAAMISRDLLRQFAEPAPRNLLYASLYNNLFASMAGGSDRMSDSFAAVFAENWRASRPYGQESLEAFLHEYFGRVLGGGGRYVVVDSGTFGTMPLLAMISDRRITDMRLLTAAPWMQEFYAGRVHSAASDRLRALEQLVCQEELFSFAGIKGESIFVKVSQDPDVVSQALAEIHSFLQIVEISAARSLL